MLTLIKNGPLRKEMGDNGLKFVTDEFSDKKINLQIMMVYEKELRFHRAKGAPGLVI
jgi:hypothetical protein